MVLASPQYNIDKIHVPALAVDKLSKDLIRLNCAGVCDAETGDCWEFINCQLVVSFWDEPTKEVYTLTVKPYGDTDHCVVRGHTYREFIPRYNTLPSDNGTKTVQQ